MNKHQKLEWIDIGKKLLKEYKFNKECEPDANKKVKFYLCTEKVF